MICYLIAINLLGRKGYESYMKILEAIHKSP